MQFHYYYFYVLVAKLSGWCILSGHAVNIFVTMYQHGSFPGYCLQSHKIITRHALSYEFGMCSILNIITRNYS